MLELARKRFADRPDVRFIAADYAGHVEENRYDIIVSALSIHHLEDPAKKNVYKHAFDSLRGGGVFINADQVLGRTAFLDSLYKSDWRRKVEASGLAREDILAAYERTKLDRMAPLESQLDWLRECGFADVDCVYKSFNFAVMYGRKR